MDQQLEANIIQKFRNIYREADSVMQTLRPVCRKGCSWCCYQLIELLNWEAPILIDYLKKNKHRPIFAEVRNNLSEWFRFCHHTCASQSELTLDEAFQHLPAEQARKRIPCPFLVDRCCVVYPVRPLSCRLHISRISSRICRINPLNDSDPDALAYRKKVVNDIVQHVPTTLRLLPLLIAPLFGFEKQILYFETYRLVPDL
ncbi:MAG TPA: hypothetical protein PLK12_05500 [Prolixibacteraceae bacterium]|nr:hypothetical protein [Prolixibacteraceae bacterium]